MRKKDWKLTLVVCLITIIYCCSGIFLDRLGVPIKLRWLYWNLFLALLPFGFGIISAILLHFKKWYTFILALPFLCGWLLFLPNSTYMITDLIHLDSSSIINWDYSYNADLKSWLAIIYLAGGIILGVVSGFISTHFIYKNTSLKKHPILKYLSMLVLSALVGYGVYIGRFLRFNTWDIIHPRSLLKVLIQDFDKFTFIFSSVMAIFFFSCYWIYQKIEEGNDYKEKYERNRISKL